MFSFTRFVLLASLMFSPVSKSFADEMETQGVVSESDKDNDQMIFTDVLYLIPSFIVSCYLTTKFISILGNKIDAVWYYALENVFDPDLVLQVKTEHQCVCFGCFNVQIGVLSALAGLLQAGGLMFSNYVVQYAQDSV